MSIHVSTNFSVDTALPIDSRYVTPTTASRDSIVWAYDGLICYVQSNQTTYQYISGSWKSFGGSSATASIANRIYTEELIVDGPAYPALLTENGPGYELLWNTSNVTINPGEGNVTANNFIGTASLAITSSNSKKIYTEELVVDGPAYVALLTENGPGYELLWNTSNVTINPGEGTVTANAFIGTASFAGTASVALNASNLPQLSSSIIQVFPDGTIVNNGSASKPSSTTSGIQEAINMLPLAANTASVGGGTIQFSPGIYYTYDTIINPPNNYPYTLTFKGAGMTAGGIVLTGSAGSIGKPAIMIASGSSGNNKIFAMDNMFVASDLNATCSVVWLRGVYNDANGSPGGMATADINFCWFGYWSSMKTNGLSPSSGDVDVKHNLIGLEADGDFSNALIIRNCQFNYLQVGLKAASDHILVHDNTFTSCGVHDHISDWPTNTLNAIGAAICVCDTHEGSPYQLTEHHQEFSNNCFINMYGNSPVYLVNNYGKLPLVSYNDSFEVDTPMISMGTGSNDFGTHVVNSSWTFINPRLYGLSSGTGADLPKYLLPVSYNTSNWNTIPASSTYVRIFDLRNRNYYDGDFSYPSGSTYIAHLSASLLGTSSNAISARTLFNDSASIYESGVADFAELSVGTINTPSLFIFDPNLSILSTGGANIDTGGGVITASLLFGTASQANTASVSKILNGDNANVLENGDANFADLTIDGFSGFAYNGGPTPAASIDSAGNGNFANLDIVGSITSSFISASGEVIVPSPVNANDAATKAYVDNLNPQGLDFYFRATSSIVAGYYDMLKLSSPLSASTNTITVNNVSASQYFVQFISPALNLANISQGTINVHVHIYRSGGGAGANSFTPELYMRSASGAEYYEFPTPSATVLGTGADDSYTIPVILTSSLALNLSDELVCKLKCNNGTNTPNITVTVDGGTAAGVQVPVPSSTFVLRGGDIMTGALTNLYGFVGTASWASNAISASYAANSSGGTATMDIINVQVFL